MEQRTEPEQKDDRSRTGYLNRFNAEMSFRMRLCFVHGQQGSVFITDKDEQLNVGVSIWYDREEPNRIENFGSLKTGSSN